MADKEPPKLTKLEELQKNWTSLLKEHCAEVVKEERTSKLAKDKTEEEIKIEKELNVMFKKMSKRQLEIVQKAVNIIDDSTWNIQRKKARKGCSCIREPEESNSDLELDFDLNKIGSSVTGPGSTSYRR